MSATSCPPTGCRAATARPPAAARRGPARPALGPGDPDGPHAGSLVGQHRVGQHGVGQHRGRCARRHLHRRLPGAAGRAAGHRVVRPAGRAGPAARADVGVQVRRRLRGRRAHRPWPARPRRRDHGYVPELAGSGFAGALVRHVYDMRSGVRFVEEYANPDSDIRRLDEWVGWQDQARGSPAGSTGSWPRCRPRPRTASGSCTVRPSLTCWAGCASARPAGPWPRSSPS